MKVLILIMMHTFTCDAENIKRHLEKAKQKDTEVEAQLSIWHYNIIILYKCRIFIGHR